MTAHAHMSKEFLPKWFQSNSDKLFSQDSHRGSKYCSRGSTAPYLISTISEVQMRWKPAEKLGKPMSLKRIKIRLLILSSVQNQTASQRSQTRIRKIRKIISLVHHFNRYTPCECMNTQTCSTPRAYLISYFANKWKNDCFVRSHKSSILFLLINGLFSHMMATVRRHIYCKMKQENTLELA